MKKVGSLLFMFLFIAGLTAGAPAIAAQVDPAGNGPSGERLAGLCRLWGFVKFCHPYLATKSIDWDAALIETLPLVREAESAEAYQKALTSLLDRLDDPLSAIEKGPSPVADPSSVTADPGIQGKPQPFVESTEDGIAVVVANDYRQFSTENTGWAKIIADFKKAFVEAAKSRRVLIDLRNLGGPYSYLLTLAVSDNLSWLLDRDIILPPLRFLTYMGYPSQKEPMIYHAELATRSGGCVRALGSSGQVPDRIVFLLNKDSNGFALQLAALQDEGRAYVVQEGEAGPASGVPTVDLDLPDSLRVRVRCAEILKKGGGVDFRPDLVIGTDARTAGLEILRGERQPERPQAAGDAGGALQDFTLVDRSYPEMAYPDKDYRLLALFRFWNVIDRFFPYKDLMDQPWDRTLLEFIPKMEAAGDALEYTLTVAELTARIQDSHGMIINPIYTGYTGRANPAVQVSFAEGLSVISLIKDPALRKKGIDLGDIVLSVDGEKTEARRTRLKKVLPASTIGRLEAKVDMTLLAGDPEKPAALSLRKASGKVVKVTLPRILEVPLRPESSSLPNVTVLPSGFGYIDLGRLLDAEVGPALEKIKGTPGLILDMRGYPIGGTFRLISRLARERKLFTLFEFPEYSGDSGYFSTREEPGYVDPDRDRFDYPGKIAVLIHGSTQSAAEHTCLGLETVADVTFIGSPTSGANGNITYAVVPGNIVLRFTGMGVRHGDGRQLQRKGIQPHIRVEPTIDGIRNGRDEILEKAVEFLKTGRG
jgi:C-terminal processing protease CtpA/Prc